MARITIDDCLRKVPSRFKIVNMAAKRVKQIRKGSDLVDVAPKNADILIALREIAAGKLIEKIKKEK